MMKVLFYILEGKKKEKEKKGSSETNKRKKARERKNAARAPLRLPPFWLGWVGFRPFLFPLPLPRMPIVFRAFTTLPRRHGRMSARTCARGERERASVGRMMWGNQKNKKQKNKNSRHSFRRDSAQETLGVIASGGREAPRGGGGGDVTLVVCMLEVRDRLAPGRTQRHLSG